ncbi:Septum site-determining protein MinD [Rosistilla carotiformis]|uniref:Septum site-determining protein MinD n=1 Tax=Rosistilla carotiformis TaxID=2528017 RepID=A0A518K0A8_9BACT|nr:AAA family ATPase [Rosistilla carotiformis]QDV71231.1 Septum site-determining protein MinD [Rosistilla carotiformis]
MPNVLRLAVVDPNDKTREDLKSMLLGLDVVWLEAECSRYEFFPDVITQTRPDIGVVSLDSDPDRGIELLNTIRSTTPDCALLVVSSSTSGQLILQSMRAGAKEFLTLPLSGGDLSAALHRIGEQKFGASDARNRNCEVIVVAGATGGVGATSVAVNMGCMLASREGNSVALMDLDLAVGDADVFLDSIPDYTLADVTQNIARLDFTLLKRSLTKHSSGLYLLPRPVELQDMSIINGDSIEKVITLLKASFTHLVIDLSKTYSEVDMAAMRMAAKIVLVTQLDVPCLRNVVRLLLSFEQFEGLKEKVHVVVNRAGLESGPISIRKARETIGCDIYAQLPNDYRTMVEVRNNGVPLFEQDPKAAITLAMLGLVDRLCGTGSDAQSEDTGETVALTENSSWLNFWPRGGKQKKSS